MTVPSSTLITRFSVWREKYTNNTGGGGLLRNFISQAKNLWITLVFFTMTMTQNSLDSVVDNISSSALSYWAGANISNGVSEAHNLSCVVPRSLVFWKLGLSLPPSVSVLNLFLRPRHVGTSIPFYRRRGVWERMLSMCHLRGGRGGGSYPLQIFNELPIAAQSMTGNVSLLVHSSRCFCLKMMISRLFSDLRQLLSIRTEIDPNDVILSCSNAADKLLSTIVSWLDGVTWSSSCSSSVIS